MIQSNLRIVLTNNFIKSTLFNKNLIKKKYNLMNVRHYSGSSNNPKPNPNNNISILIMLGIVGILSIINRKGPDDNGDIFFLN